MVKNERNDNLARKPKLLYILLLKNRYLFKLDRLSVSTAVTCSVRCTTLQKRN